MFIVFFLIGEGRGEEGEMRRKGKGRSEDKEGGKRTKERAGKGKYKAERTSFLIHECTFRSRLDSRA